VNVPVRAPGSREIVYVVHHVRDVTALVGMARRLAEETVVQREMEATVRRMRSELVARRRVLHRTERRLAVAMQALAAGQPAEDVALPAAPGDAAGDRSYLGAGAVPPEPGCYHAYHPPSCTGGFAHRVAVDERPLPRCRVCGDDVRYRLVLRIP
jgi:hypothetical protein